MSDARAGTQHGRIFGNYAYAWLTLTFFAISFGLHWLFGWVTYAHESAAHGQPPDLSDYIAQMLRDTFENWQSEFLQLLWQVVGLAYFLYLGSPASKESGNRLEEKIDAILRRLDPHDGEGLISSIDRKYLRNTGRTRP